MYLSAAADLCLVNDRRQVGSLTHVLIATPTICLHTMPTLQRRSPNQAESLHAVVALFPPATAPKLMRYQCARSRASHVLSS